MEEMNKFLESYDLPKLNQEESENLNRWNSTSKIEAVIKKTSQQTKTLDQIVLQVKFTKHSEKN